MPTLTQDEFKDKVKVTSKLRNEAMKRLEKTWPAPSTNSDERKSSISIAKNENDPNYEKCKFLYQPFDKSFQDVKSISAKIMQNARVYCHSPSAERSMQVLNEVKQWIQENKTSLRKIHCDLCLLGEQRFHSRISAPVQSYFQALYSEEFNECLEAFNNAVHRFKQMVVRRQKRQLRIIDPELTEEQQIKIVQADQMQSYLHDYLISGHQVLGSIETRHLEIIALERSVLETLELFKDLSMLVDLQQQSLNTIESRIKMALKLGEKGEIDLTRGEIYQKKGRKVLCCILLFLLLICIIVLSVIFTR